MKTFSFIATSLILSSAQAGDDVGYNYDQLGADWGDIDAEGNVCGTGLEQSPIDLVRTAEGSDVSRLSGWDYMNWPEEEGFFL